MSSMAYEKNSCRPTVNRKNLWPFPRAEYDTPSARGGVGRNAGGSPDTSLLGFHRCNSLACGQGAQ
jgi:hypothetical protein